MEAFGNKLFNTVINAVAKNETAEKFKSLRHEVDKFRLRERLHSVKNDEPEVIEEKAVEQEVDDKHEPKWKRSNMGHFLYNSKKGMRPLTVRDLPSPGPGDYLPDYTKQSHIQRMPEYSIRSAAQEDRINTSSPGPKYQTSPGFLLKPHKQTTLKGRAPPYFPQQGQNGPGPGRYSVKYGAVGSQPNHAKPTIKAKTDIRYKAGLKLTHEHPIESAGYINTEEQFMVDKTVKSIKFGDAPKWSFAGKYKSTVANGPGPSQYGIPQDPHRQPPPGHTMAGRLQKEVETREETIPGPDAYRPTFADKYQNPRAIVIPKRESMSGKCAPAPNEYHVKGQYDKARKHHDGRGPNITFRHHDLDEAEKLPGPSSYNPNYSHRVPGGPFISSSRRPVTNHDCLMTGANLAAMQSVPGAASYNPQNHCIGRNSRPRFSFGTSRRQTKRRDRAGPGDYNITGLTRTGYTPGPQFSLAGKVVSRFGLSHKEKTTPTAAGDYYVDQSHTFSKKGYTMQGRNKPADGSSHKAKKTSFIPGPQYNVRGLTHRGGSTKCLKGVSMTSRCSPHVYAGIGEDVRLQPHNLKSTLDNISFG